MSICINFFGVTPRWLKTQNDPGTRIPCNIFKIKCSFLGGIVGEWLISFMCCYNNKLTDNGHIYMFLNEWRPSLGAERRYSQKPLADIFLWLSNSHSQAPSKAGFGFLRSGQRDKDLMYFLHSNFLLSSRTQHSLNFIFIPHRRFPLFSMHGDILHSFRFLVLKEIWDDGSPWVSLLLMKPHTGENRYTPMSSVPSKNRRTQETAGHMLMKSRHGKLAFC